MAEGDFNATILVEFHQSVKEYVEVKQEFDKIRAKLGTKWEKLKAVKSLLADCLPGTELTKIDVYYPNIRFVAMPIGDAIKATLQRHAFVSAKNHIQNPLTPYKPALGLEEIYRILDAGGFEFQSATPRREINAALMRLQGVEPLENGRYQIADPKGKFEIMKGVLEKQNRERQAQ